MSPNVSLLLLTLLFILCNNYRLLSEGIGTISSISSGEALSQPCFAGVTGINKFTLISNKRAEFSTFPESYV